ncbi:MAG: aldo/keto reductase [Herpetosiphon sp.]
MEYRTLIGTDISVSVVAMGCWAIVGDAIWGKQDETTSLSTIHAALDAGITFFDTAEAYGDGYSEVLLGKVLADQRHQVVIASKVSGANLAPDDLRQACERSLQRMKTDYIDLYQIHWPNAAIPLAETMGALEELRAQGKVRAIGVSNFGPHDLDDLKNVGHVVSNQLPYSLVWRAIEFEIQQRCVENNIGILCYSPLMQGLLTGKFKSPDDVPDGRTRSRHFARTRPLSRHTEPGCEIETFEAIDRIRQISGRIDEPMARVALGWLLQQPGVTSVLAGARNPEQIHENVQSATLQLAPELIAALRAATDELKEKLGANPDMWSTESRFR